MKNRTLRLTGCLVMLFALGVDFLRDARLWLSYASSQVFMQYTTGPAAAAMQKYFSQPHTDDASGTSLQAASNRL